MASAEGAAQSFELARVLDGEKAMRAEAARRKADVDRRLAQAAADSAGAAALQAEQSALNAQLQQHSGQVRAAPQSHISATVPSIPLHPAVSSTGVSLARYWMCCRWSCSKVQSSQGLYAQWVDSCMQNRDSFGALGQVWSDERPGDVAHADSGDPGRADEGAG